MFDFGAVVVGGFREEFLPLNHDGREALYSVKVWKFEGPSKLIASS
jgi:hypothetical protein